MDFGSIIKRSWHITWRYRALWVLGIFAGVSGCQGGGGGGNGGGSSNISNDLSSGAPDFRSWADSVQQWLPALVAGAVLLVLISIVWWVLGVAARGGMVVGVDRIEQGSSPTVGELWAAGFARFWTLLGLEVMLRIPILLVLLFVLAGVFVPLMGAIVGTGDVGPGIVAPICGSLAIGLPLLLVLGFVLGVMELIAKRYVMLGGQGAVQAAQNGWRFFRVRFKDTFLMWLINAGLNLAASLVLIVPAFVVGLVVAVPAVLAARSESWTAFIPIIGVAMLLLIALSIVYSAIWGTFTSSLWTIFFRRVAGLEQPVEAPISGSPYAGEGISLASPAPPGPVTTPMPEPPAPPADRYPQYPPAPPTPPAPPVPGA
ncbi:MAG: hypothetical protein CVT67_02415 [Actinobacteria bacterium HGW-Actinobacteria-7]|jgi:hypothetical protein|nr:MAG: hypothetical protein CVT67_02415 [Actinobacteria bacterium HGW-Actinobacteria-7]